MEVLRSGGGALHLRQSRHHRVVALIDALTEAHDVSYVLALQEATAVAMADGYAQGARRSAFLNLHTAGGWATAWQPRELAGLGHAAGRHRRQQTCATRSHDPLLMGDLVAIADP